MLEEGYELITMSITNSAKAILVFKKTNLITHVNITFIFMFKSFLKIE